MFIKTADASLLVSAFGRGPRTFVAHGGWVGSGELWHAPFDILSRSWRTVTYDHRGTGGTTHTAAEITFEMLVADLFTVLDRLDIKDCVIAAESAGAGHRSGSGLAPARAFFRSGGRRRALLRRPHAAARPIDRRLQGEFPGHNGGFRQCLHAGGRL